MRLIAIFAFVAGLLAAGAAQAQDAEAVKKAEAATGQWLALVDAGRFAASWDQAAGPFKAAVSKSDWETALQGVRAPLGAVKERKQKSAQFTRSLPGVPEGEYVVIQFATQFANRTGAAEVVTQTKDKDGHWRVTGYFIK